MCFRKMLMLIVLSTLGILLSISNSLALPVCSFSPVDTLYRINDEPHCKVVQYFYGTKEIRGKGEIKNKERHGKWTFFRAGKKESEGYFEFGKKNGEWIFFAWEGYLRARLNYINDKRANNAYNALQRLSNQESYIIKKRKRLKKLIEELTVFDDNNFKIVKVNTKGN